jgi:hypothetical protein|tara:strand:+ start:1041 stop:1670 length:630 start_codon:yes stop_codon:yes gene_type:complete
MTKQVLAPQDWQSINFSLKNNKITIIDDFFIPEILSILKIRMLYTKHVDKNYGTYQAIDYQQDQDYITQLIVKEFKNKLDILPPFQRAWSFVYENESSGVILHADPSQFNVNIWISSDESVKDKLVNGLSIYEIVPPPDWGRKDWNRNEEKAQSYIDSHHVKPININYKSNRAVIFNGAYFHKSHPISMKEGVENRRVSYTMLFGSQLE